MAAGGLSLVDVASAQDATIGFRGDAGDEGVVALCALDADRFFSVDASGEVLEWRDGAIAADHSLPRPGTARAIAVHPDTPRGPLLAVGLKLEGRVRRGYVACVGLER